MKKWRMDRSKKSFIGVLLILAGASVEAYRASSLGVIALALVGVGAFMCISAAIAESFWHEFDTAGYDDAGDDTDDVDDEVDAAGRSNEHA